MIERCLDDAPSVGAAAVRCSLALARLELLTDDDMDFVRSLRVLCGVCVGSAWGLCWVCVGSVLGL